MPDMLVKLYDLPDLHEPLCRINGIGIETRRPNPWEKFILLKWVESTFSSAWALECETAFAANPPSCYIAVEKDALIGFACFDCTRRNFFGPTGVAEAARGKGVGLTLLLSCLHAMRDDGYAYAIIGGVGPEAYYARTVGATLIEGSSPGIYDFGLTRKMHAPDSRT
jgi:GNAT superfamily N-acetyltransferase